MNKDRIRELRKDLGLSQKAFGQKINLSQNHIASLESGERNLTDRVAEDICRIFAVNRDWLLNGIPPIYVDLLKNLDVSEDVKQVAHSYNKLDAKNKQLVKELIDSLLDKH